MGQVINKIAKVNDGAEKEKQLQSELAKLVNEKYEELLKNVKTTDDLYRALYEILQELSKRQGAMDFNLPTKGELDAAFKKYHASTTGILGREAGGVLTREEFRSIIKEVVKFDSFYVGEGARDAFLFLFGAPLIGLLAKRFIPGISSLSDDVVIPAFTSGAVVLLTKTNRL